MGRGLSPLPREREIAHEADAHLAGNSVACDLAGELERQRHRVGDRNLPGEVVAVDGAVENLDRIAVGGLRPGQRAARAFQAQRSVALAHGRRHGEIPVSVHGHLSLLENLTKPEMALVSAKRPYSVFERSGYRFA